MPPFTCLSSLSPHVILFIWKQSLSGAHTEEGEVHQGGEGAAAGAGEGAGAGVQLLSFSCFSVLWVRALKVCFDVGAQEEAAGVRHTGA